MALHPIEIIKKVQSPQNKKAFGRHDRMDLENRV